MSTRKQTPHTATTVFGIKASVVSYLNLYFISFTDKGILPAECQETADLILFMDNIFDSVNGSYKKNKNAKPLLGPARPNSIHNETWVEGIKMFKSMSFIASNGKKESVPTVENWVWTLKSIQILLKKLEVDFEVSSVWLRHLNQDPLENFFGAVRSHGCRNTNPTCDQFESAFATLLINKLSSVHTPGKNCELDYCNALHSLIINDNVEPTSTCTFDFAGILEFNFEPLEKKESDPRKIAPLQYVSGYFLKKAKTRIFQSCTNCKTDLSSDDAIEYIQYREYAGRRWLCTPSKELVEAISNMQDLINKIIPENFEKNNLKEIIKTSILITVDFRFVKCTSHKDKLIDYLIDIVIRCLVFNYCKNINKILAGKKQVDDDEDHMQIKAKKLNKCIKRHR